MIFTTSALLLLLYSINVDVTLLVVEAQVSYDGCRFKRWSLIPPNKILVLLSIDSHIIIFPNVSVRVRVTSKSNALTICLAFVRTCGRCLAFSKELPTNL